MELIRQNYLSRIRSSYDLDIIKVITGVRRCGKSVLLKQIHNELINDLHINDDHILWLPLEDLDYKDIKEATDLNDFILEQIKDKDKYYIFIDEIQHIKNFEKALASLKATQNVSLFITGSCSTLLSGQLSSLLVGRCLEFRMLPFSYKEAKEWMLLNKRQVDDNFLKDFLMYGGFPFRFYYAKDKEIRSYLESVFTGILERDICPKRGPFDKGRFLKVAKYILNNSGKIFSPNSLIESYKKENPKETLQTTQINRYLERMENAYLIFRVDRYDIPSKRILKKCEKHYVVDNGFRTISLSSNQMSLAYALENLVYTELLHRDYTVWVGKTYRGEVDFTVMKDNKKCYIQVTYSLASQEIINREFNAFKSIKDNCPKYVISMDDWDFSQDGIIHINIRDWLEGKKELFFLD